MTSTKASMLAAKAIDGRSPRDRGTVGNRILAGLSASDFERIGPHLRHMVLTQHQRLLSPDVPTDEAYFLETGMVSLILSLEDGNIVEVGLVGKEGIVGVLAGLGASRISGEAIVQMPGSAWAMKTDRLRQEIGVSATIRQMLLRYVQALFAQITQSAACNARHQLPQRLARWLLMANDCAETNEVRLTHEFLSMMLSVRRAGVTMALRALSDAGTITAGRGRIFVLDRAGLEATACECYHTVRAEYERLLDSKERS